MKYSYVGRFKQGRTEMGEIQAKDRDEALEKIRSHDIEISAVYDEKGLCVFDSRYGEDPAATDRSYRSSQRIMASWEETLLSKPWNILLRDSKMLIMEQAEKGFPDIRERAFAVVDQAERMIRRKKILKCSIWLLVILFVIGISVFGYLLITQ